MKIALALVLLMAPLMAPAFAAESSSKAEKEVLATLDTWKTAMLKGDAAALGKLYHADLTYEHSSAKTETKSESIQNATAPAGIAKSIQFIDPKVRVYGNTALVKSKADIVSNAGAMNHLDVLMVFLKTGSGWQLIARQATKLP